MNVLLKAQERVKGPPLLSKTGSYGNMITFAQWLLGPWDIATPRHVHVEILPSAWLHTLEGMVNLLLFIVTIVCLAHPVYEQYQIELILCFNHCALRRNDNFRLQALKDFLFYTSTPCYHLDTVKR